MLFKSVVSLLIFCLDDLSIVKSGVLKSLTIIALLFIYLFSFVVHAKSLQFQSCTILCDPMDPLSAEFSRQEDWSGLPFPTPGDLPNPRIEPRTPTFQADSLPSEKVGKPLSFISVCFICCGAVILGS